MGEDLDDIFKDFVDDSGGKKEKKTDSKELKKSEKEAEEIAKEDVGTGEDIGITEESEEKKEESTETEPELKSEEEAKEKSKEKVAEKSVEKEEESEDIGGDLFDTPDEGGEEKSEDGTDKKPEKKDTTDDLFESRKVGSPDEFDLSTAKERTDANFVIYGKKGYGKTYLAYTVPGTHRTISFDNKSQPIRDEMVDSAIVKDGNILVYDGVRYIDESTPETKLESSSINWRYLNAVIKNKGFEESDWVDVDGGEIFHRMAEMVMRDNNGLMPYAGFANLNLWKERRQYISQFFHLCRSKAKRGIIWTAYTDKDEIMKEGEFVTKKDVPNWIDAVMYETDVVIFADADKDKQGSVSFYATIESCKIPKKVQKKLFGGELIVGKRVDVTGKGFIALIGNG